MSHPSPIHAQSWQTTVDKPASRRLAELLVHLSGKSDASDNNVDKCSQVIHNIIQKYDSVWPRLDSRIVQPVSRERVVVTGTTGALGSHLLAQLLESDKVEKVWAMNRKSSRENKEREVLSFEDKLLDVSLLKSKKLVFVDADLEDRRLGLCDGMYDEIRSEATLIIHNAWEVNFNLSLKSFEPNICGTRNLLDFAFHSIAPTGLPRFAFASSITVAGFRFNGMHLSESSVSLEDGATSIGYGQSKLITEKLLESARYAGLPTCIVRIGQLAGDVKSGSWSTTDWVPSLILSSISVGCLPGALGVVSWLPLDVAARSTIELCVGRNVELPLVAYVSHPRPVSWMAIINAFSTSIASRTGSQLPIVRFDEWNKHMAEAVVSFHGSKRDCNKHFPITKIQSLIDQAVQADNMLRLKGEVDHAEFGGLITLETTVAESFSETLRSTPRLGMEHVEKWIDYWKSVGFFKYV
ncbi:hypothetical protein OPQ81_007317 [Rhizoctonia solani]|nr:hypothetical protein OPQ81_007317 [Rhizoctonia solani]